MPPKPLKLTKQQREFCQERLGRDHGDAELWAFPDLERQTMTAEMEEDSDLTMLDSMRRNIHWGEEVNDEECEALLEMRLFSNDLRWRGVAKRLIGNTLSDLRTALSLEARIDWFQRGAFGSLNGGCYPEAWRILRALAVRDVAVARRYFEVNDKPLKGGHPPTVLLYNGLLAVLTKNKTAQSDFLGRLGKVKSPEPHKALHNVLGAIITNDPAAVVAGLAQVMATFRRMDLFDEEKIICFFAHGLVELALETNPKLVAMFDFEQGLPWDAEFFAWLRNQSPTPVFPELARRSPLLDAWLNRLEPPRWWAQGD